MQIWVDADACPGEVKELLFRAARRTKTKVTLVANQAMRTPRSEFVDSLLCTQMQGCHLVEGAGHWVQQEQPEEVSRLLIEFLQQRRG